MNKPSIWVVASMTLWADAAAQAPSAITANQQWAATGNWGDSLRSCDRAMFNHAIQGANFTSKSKTSYVILHTTWLTFEKCDVTYCDVICGSGCAYYAGRTTLISSVVQRLPNGSQHSRPIKTELVSQPEEGRVPLPCSDARALKDLVTVRDRLLGTHNEYLAAMRAHTQGAQLQNYP